MIDRGKLKDGDTFWYVQEGVFEESDENGECVAHKEFYCTPKIFNKDDDLDFLFNPDRMFASESDANVCAFELSNRDGF